jgi:hypothetical protein
MRGAGGDEKQVARTGVSLSPFDDLNAFAGEEKNELGVVVPMMTDFGIPVPVELKFAQNEAEGMDLDFLNEDGTPGRHVGNVLSKVGNVLTQACGAR